MESLNTNQTNQTSTKSYEDKAIEQLIEESQNYISIKDGETKVLQFTPEKTEIVEKKDFNNKPIKKVQFMAFDVNDAKQKEKRFELSTVHAGKIYDHLKRGNNALEISRLGQGKDTRYFIKVVK